MNETFVPCGRAGARFCCTLSKAFPACEFLRLQLTRGKRRPRCSPHRVRPAGVIMGVEWLPIFLSALASGLLSLLISDIHYRVSVRSADRHHIAQPNATAKRHAKQMERKANHHAEQLLVLRTTLL